MLSNKGKQERRDCEMWLRCEACHERIFIEREPYALDKNGETLCRGCHIKVVLLLRLRGVKWQGQTFGYELEDADEV